MMAGVKSVVTINEGLLRRMSSAQARALEKTAEALLNEIRDEQVIPRDEGTLQGEATFVDNSKASKGKVSIVSSTPYARRLYYHPEYHFHREPWTDEKGKEHEGNANARGEWYKPWMKGGEHEDRAKELYQKFYREEAGI